MINKPYLFCAMLALSGLAQAQQGESTQRAEDRSRSIDVLFSNKTLEARYLRDAQLFDEGNQDLFLGAYLNTDNSFQFTGGLSTEVLKDFTPLGSNLKFALGSRLYMSRLASPSNNVFGLGVGGGWSLTLPKRIKLPLSLRGNYYYAPEVLTSGNDQDILDFDIVEVQLDLAKNLAGIFGFREMTVGNRSLDNNWNVGVRYKF